MCAHEHVVGTWGHVKRVRTSRKHDPVDGDGGPTPCAALCGCVHTSVGVSAWVSHQRWPVVPEQVQVDAMPPQQLHGLAKAQLVNQVASGGEGEGPGRYGFEVAPWHLG